MSTQVLIESAAPSLRSKKGASETNSIAAVTPVNATTAWLLQGVRLLPTAPCPGCAVCTCLVLGMLAACGMQRALALSSWTCTICGAGHVTGLAIEPAACQDQVATTNIQAANSPTRVANQQI